MSRAVWCVAAFEVTYTPLGNGMRGFTSSVDTEKREWCATADGEQHAHSVKTVGTEKRAPTCSACRKAVTRG